MGKKDIMSYSEIQVNLDTIPDLDEIPFGLKYNSQEFDLDGFSIIGLEPEEEIELERVFSQEPICKQPKIESKKIPSEGSFSFTRKWFLGLSPISKSLFFYSPIAIGAASVSALVSPYLPIAVIAVPYLAYVGAEAGKLIFRKKIKKNKDLAESVIRKTDLVKSNKQRTSQMRYLERRAADKLEKIRTELAPHSRLSGKKL